MAQLTLVDAHAHLQEEVLEEHLPGVMARAADAGVRWIVCNGTHENDWAQTAAIARTYSGVAPCFGLHPWFVSERSPEWLGRLEERLLAVPSGVGEIGLDRWHEPRDEAAQEVVFRQQLALARRLERPVVIHCLRAWGWLMEVLREVDVPPAGMLLHAYGGPPDLIRPLAGMGGFFSFAGDVLDERRRRKREALRAVPLDRLLIETDAPAMLPPESARPYVVRGAEGEVWNEPANLPAILEGIASLLGLAPERLADLTRQNAERLFGGIGCQPTGS